MKSRYQGPHRLPKSDGRVVLVWREGDEPRSSCGSLTSIYPDEVFLETDEPPPLFQVVRFRLESEPEWFQAFVTRRDPDGQLALVFLRRCFIRFYRTVAGERKMKEMVRSQAC